MEWLGYAAVGALVGVLAGMLGIGGGAVTVPLLVLLFERQGLPRSTLLLVAVGTAMAAVLFTSISSVWAHAVRGAVRWDIVRRITPGILAGGLAGALVASLIPTRGLALFFALFVYVLATNMLLERKTAASRALPGPIGMFLAGTAISGISALAALGGAAMSVPFMVLCRVPMLHAIGTASAIGFTIAVAGTVGYVVTGLGHALPAPSLGYVYLPALAGMVVAGMLTAPLGAVAAHRLPTRRLRQAFALMLYLLATRTLLRLWS
jgi:uncharacterized membrane protein YfcA